MLNKEVNKRVYEKFIREIEEKILKGKLKQGDKLPTERELSEIMNISRPSIREGMRVLESRGVVESVQGEGNFISCNSEKSILQPLLLLSKLKNVNCEEAFELRRMLEIENVKLAVIKSTDLDHQELLDIIYKMNRQLNNDDGFKILEKLDIEFHNKIASISKNNMIKFLYEIVINIYNKFIECENTDLIKYNIDKSKLYYHHEMICNAIINRNCDLAVEIMKKHMQYVGEQYISNLDD